MELDDLKTGWKASSERIRIPSRDILSLITNRENGPVSELKNRFRKGLIIVPLVVAIALSRIPHHHGFIFNLLFCFLLVFALSMTGYFYYNYKLLGRSQAMDVPLKVHLQTQARLLEKGVRFRLFFTRGMAILFIGLIEGFIYWGNDLRGWNDAPLTTRLTVYAAAFAVFYLVTYVAVKHRYSKSIIRLKELVNEME